MRRYYCSNKNQLPLRARDDFSRLAPSQAVEGLHEGLQHTRIINAPIDPGRPATGATYKKPSPSPVAVVAQHDGSNGDDDNNIGVVDMVCHRPRRDECEWLQLRSGCNPNG